MIFERMTIIARLRHDDAVARNGRAVDEINHFLTIDGIIDRLAHAQRHLVDELGSGIRYDANG